MAVKSSDPYIAEMYVKPEQYIISICVRDLVGDVVNYFQLQKTIEWLGITQQLYWVILVFESSRNGLE